MHLHQQPLPEVALLRLPGREWQLSAARPVVVQPGLPQALPHGAEGPFLELQVVVQPLGPPLDLDTDAPLELRQQQRPAAGQGQGEDGGACGGRCSGVMLHSWKSGNIGGAALLYHWDSGVLEVVSCAA